jgi:hypothetical protein
LAQYATIGFVNPRKIYDLRLEHEPISGTSSSEVHVIAISSETAEILCYIALKGAISAPLQVTMRSSDRSLFPVEDLFGWGIFNRLKLLPDLAVAKVREIGRFVKNQQRPRSDALVARAPVEVGTMIIKILVGPLRQEIDACIGDFEEEVAKKTMDFFHMPLVVLHGVVPFSDEHAYLRMHVENSSVYPFAFLTSDLSTSMDRLTAIEQALALDGNEGLTALQTLRDGTCGLQSTLSPSDGMTPLSDVLMPQKNVSMETRRQWLNAGDELRKVDLFSTLSGAEAAVLGTFMERIEAKPGELLIRQGTSADGFYLIESGCAEIQVKRADGTRVIVTESGPGTVFGEIAVITDSERTADVVAKTRMHLLKLSKEAYTRYVAQLPEVEIKLSRLALQKTQEQLRKLKSS